ncbi:hypothetical protein Tco_0792462 [Tanacetum coccineum]
MQGYVYDKNVLKSKKKRKVMIPLSENGVTENDKWQRGLRSEDQGNSMKLFEADANKVDEDKARQLVIMNLAVEYDNASITKDDLRKAYEESNDILQEKRALIDTFLKEESDKDYEMHNVLFWGGKIRTTNQ